MATPEITEGFLKALDRYFAGEILLDKAVVEAGLKTRKQFQERIRLAYLRHMLVVRSPIDPDLCTQMREWIGPAHAMEVYVVKGSPDDLTFSRGAAEKLMLFLKKLLLDTNKKEINIGIVSGSSTGATIDRLIHSGLCEEIIGGHPIKGKDLNLIAINATTLDGWELQGNANIATLRLAEMLKLKLPDCNVTPYGVSTALVVNEKQKSEEDKRHRKILQFVDPSRTSSSCTHESKLDLLVTGVGTPEKSVFNEVIKAEEIEPPDNIVGDVAFSPVDEKGREVPLLKDKERYVVYSTISLDTMCQLAAGHAVVMLIARNSRRGEYVDKTQAIRAAIRGKYVNVIFTDEETTKLLLLKPFYG